MKRPLLLLGLILATMAAIPVPAEACSCIPAGPPCEAVWQAGLVFSGTVTEIVPLEPARPGLPPAFAPKRIRFAVKEAFRGTDTKEIELHSRGGGSGMCEFDFRVGQEYLVYAHHRGDAAGWSTSTCSRTRLLRHAAEDLAYLRLPVGEKGRSRIVGRVVQRRLDRSSGYDRWAERPVPGVPATQPCPISQAGKSSPMRAAVSASRWSLARGMKSRHPGYARRQPTPSARQRQPV